MDAKTHTRNHERTSIVNTPSSPALNVPPDARWTFHPAAALDKHATRWRDLNNAGANSPVLDPDVILAALAHFAAGDEQLAILEHAGATLAMTVVRRKSLFVWETFQPSQNPLGAWVVAPGNSSAAIARSQLAHTPGYPLLLGVTQLDPELYERPADAGNVSTVDYIKTARITVQGTFDEYWNARGKNLRQNMKRQRNLLQRENVNVRLEMLTRPDDMAPAIAEYGRLESAGWKAGEGTAIAPDNAQGKFYIQLLRAFAARGAAHVYKYWYDAHLAAMDLCISHHGVIVILKTTYDESIKNSSPAMLMRQDAFKEIFDQRVFARIEFYGKLMEWHTRWTDEVRTLYHLNCYRWAPLKRLLAR